MEDDWQEVMRYLESNLGVKLVAYCSGLKTKRPVRLWRKRKKPRIETEMRVRYTYRAILFVIEAFGSDTAKSWLFGRNQNLNDHAPAWVLRHGKKIEDLKSVVDAAKKFVVA
jgi:hypothetical protein